MTRKIINYKYGELMKLTGGCQCGSVNYKITGPTFNSVLCHCHDCRKSSGAPAFAWFNVKINELHWIGNQPKEFASSKNILRGFCEKCGTTLTYFEKKWPDMIDVATATLEDPEKVPPQAHIYMQQRMRWLQIQDDLPDFLKSKSQK
jgi:hypothetical protein